MKTKRTDRIAETHFGPVWFIPGENRGKYPYCHSVYVEGAGILIDPASDRERLAQLREDPGVKEVWLSHAHEDHFMHLDLFDDLPLCVTEPDARPLSHVDAIIDAYGTEEKDREFWRVFLTEQCNFRPRTPSRYLKDGEVIRQDGVTIEVIGTPGHTPGHVAFFFPEPGVLFLGDYDLTRFGPWYGDVLSSIEETVHSVEQLKNIPAAVWLACHEDGVFEQNPGELWDQYLGVMERREEKLMSLLETPHDLEEISRAWIVYGKPREPEDFFLFGEKSHMRKHLDRLVKQGKVVLDRGAYHRV
jgi:glyoxylase-like metal-dependent hydrolase (beta-lactamase superfamily II)